MTWVLRKGMDRSAAFLVARKISREGTTGHGYLTEDAPTVTRGKEVFAQTCARCHSSKLPASVQGLDPHGCAGPGYMDCWNKYWQSTKTAAFTAV